MSMFTNFPEHRMGSFVVIILAIITVSNIIAARIVGEEIGTCFIFMQHYSVH